MVPRPATLVETIQMQTDIPINAMSWFQTVCFDQEKDTFVTLVRTDKLQKVWNPTNDNLRRRHFLLTCRCVISNAISSPTIQVAMRDSLKIRRLEEMKHWSLARQIGPLLLLTVLIARKYNHSSLPGFSCLLLVPVNLLSHLDSSVNEFNSSVKS